MRSRARGSRPPSWSLYEGEESAKLWFTNLSFSLSFFLSFFLPLSSSLSLSLYLSLYLSLSLSLSLSFFLSFSLSFSLSLSFTRKHIFFGQQTFACIHVILCCELGVLWPLAAKYTWGRSLCRRESQPCSVVLCVFKF